MRPPIIASRNPDMVTWFYYGDGEDKEYTTTITLIIHPIFDFWTWMLIKTHDLQVGEPLRARKFITDGY